MMLVVMVLLMFLLLLVLLLQLVLVAGVRVLALLSVGGLVVTQQLGRGAGGIDGADGTGGTDGADGAPRGMLLVLRGAPAIQHVGVQGAGD